MKKNRDVPEMQVFFKFRVQKAAVSPCMFGSKQICNIYVIKFVIVFFFSQETGIIQRVVFTIFGTEHVKKKSFCVR